MAEKDFGHILDRGREVAAKGSDELFETVGVCGEVSGIRDL